MYMMQMCTDALWIQLSSAGGLDRWQLRLARRLRQARGEGLSWAETTFMNDNIITNSIIISISISSSSSIIIIMIMISSSSSSSSSGSSSSSSSSSNIMISCIINDLM